MIRGRDDFDSIVGPRWSQSEFGNRIRPKAVIVLVRSLSPRLAESSPKVGSKANRIGTHVKMLSMPEHLENLQTLCDARALASWPLSIDSQGLFEGNAPWR